MLWAVLFSPMLFAGVYYYKITVYGIQRNLFPYKVTLKIADNFLEMESALIHISGGWLIAYVCSKIP